MPGLKLLSRGLVGDPHVSHANTGVHANTGGRALTAIFYASKAVF